MQLGLHLSLSKRKKLPVIHVDGVEYSFPIWQYKQARFISKTGLCLDTVGVAWFLNEFDFYSFPKIGDLTILDIGAGCGETAWKFLDDGAKSVIAIECDPKRFHMLQQNVVKLGMAVLPVGEPFQIEHLSRFNYDLIKCDVEGYEMLLVEYGGVLKPCIVEVHTNWIRDRFIDHGFRIMATIYNELAGVGVYLMNNFGWYVK